MDAQDENFKRKKCILMKKTVAKNQLDDNTDKDTDSKDNDQGNNDGPPRAKETDDLPDEKNDECKKPTGNTDTNEDNDNKDEFTDTQIYQITWAQTS